MPYINAPEPEDSQSDAVQICITDRAIGVVMMVSGVVVMLLAVTDTWLRVIIEAALGFEFGGFFSKPGMVMISQNSLPPSPPSDPIHTLTVTLLLLTGVLAVACGIGIFRSSRAWFFTTIVFLCLVSVLGGGVGLLCLFIAGYCVLRLNTVLHDQTHR